MVTGRGCFPVDERGHRWLPESRPAVPSSGTHICVPRGSGIAFHRAGTGERAPRGRAVMGQSSGWPISLDKIVNPREGDNVVA